MSVRGSDKGDLAHLGAAMVSGHFAYQLQTDETADGLVADKQKRKFLRLGSSRWVNDRHIPSCRTEHKM